jgi:hypothetical protein
VVDNLESNGYFLFSGSRLTLPDLSSLVIKQQRARVAANKQVLLNKHTSK